MCRLQTISITPVQAAGPIAMLMVIVLSGSSALGSCGNYVLRGGVHSGTMQSSGIAHDVAAVHREDTVRREDAFYAAGPLHVAGPLQFLSAALRSADMEGFHFRRPDFGVVLSQPGPVVLSEWERIPERVPGTPCSEPGCRRLPEMPQSPVAVVPFQGRTLDLQAVVLADDSTCPASADQSVCEPCGCIRPGFPARIDIPPERV